MAMAKDPRALFRRKAPAIMRRLMDEFGLDAEGAAAVLGNLGHESGGFRFLQEKKPLVPGSRGGWGWAQWTGPRRRAFEAWIEARGLDPASDAANYGFLAYELRGPEARAIPAVRRARGLAGKVKAFEASFERAGVKHYPSRERWASVALAAFEAAEDRGKNDSPAGSSGPPDGHRPPHGQQSDEIREVQRLLDGFGYHEVGEIDGKWGGRTAGAIAAFRNDRGLPGEPRIDDALVAEMEKAHREGWRRPIAETRREKTADDIAPRVETVRETAWSRLWAKLLAIPGAIVAFFSAMIDNLDAAREKVQPVLDVLGTVPPWLWALLVTGAGVMIWRSQRKAERATVELYREGRLVS
ncbi:MAG: peptidoglycan-binding protein [Thermomicrobiales bacterium]|nr:peptidoglycan-binding protein [Thermomicrobiales bacterium]